MRTGGDIEAPVRRALRFAAAGISFDPRQAVTPEVVGTRLDPMQAAWVLASLRTDCEQDPAQDGHWVMRVRSRHRILGGDAGRTAQEDWPAAEEAPEAHFVLEALRGAPAYSPQAIDALLARADAGAELSRIAHALELAGPEAPGHAALSRLRAAINRRDAERHSKEMLAPGFYGRESQLRRILSYCARGSMGGPARALFISGGPGSGKSYLIERAIEEARRKQGSVVLRLDFARRGLSTLERDALVNEVSRQLGDDLPRAAAELRDLRMRFAMRSDYAPSDGQIAPVALVDAMARAVRSAERPVLVVLDTVEALREQGETHPGNLFRLLDCLLAGGIGPMAIVAAGNECALDTATDRVELTIPLDGLDRAAAGEMLAAAGVPRERHDEIHSASGGNPLLLRLGAEVIDEGGPEALALQSAPQDAAPLPADVLQEMRLALGAGDIREAAAIHDRFPDALEGRSETGRLSLAYLWFSGRWSGVQRLWSTLNEDAVHELIAEERGPVGRAVLEMEAEYRFAPLVRRLSRDGNSARAAVAAALRGEALAMRGGALALALGIAFHGIATMPSSARAREIGDVLRADIAAVRARWLSLVPAVVSRTLAGDARQRQPPDPQAAVLTERLDIEAGEQGRDGEHGFLQDQLRMNPYGLPLQRLVATGGGPTLCAHLQDFFPHLPEFIELTGSRDRFPAWERLSAHAAADAPEILSALGLAADWAAGFSFFHPVADVPEIGRSAEAWRRTVCGAWCYRERPPGVRDRGDQGLAVTLEALLSRDDPPAAARRLLALLADPAHPDDPAAVEPVLRRRASRLLREAAAAVEGSGEARAGAVAELLAEAGLPRPVAAALAVGAADEGATNRMS
jgi:hypothetical protein